MRGMSLPSEDAADNPALVPPTDFELALSSAADGVMAVRRTGYNWGPVDRLLREKLRGPTGRDLRTRCKQTDRSGRAANVLTESNDKDIDLYVIFIRPPYTAEQFVRVARNRIARFPKVKTVAVAEQDATGTWRVGQIVEREGIGLTPSLRSLFPLVDADDTTVVQTTFDATADDVPPVERADEDSFAASIADLRTEIADLNLLPQRFRRFAEDSGVTIDSSTAIDLLACMLSSQMLLLAGPSGTGKSTLARLVARFLTRDTSVGIIESKRGWVSPEDAFGYYSSLTERFSHTSETTVLTDMHEACAASLSQAPAGCPVLLVEEANLSPIDGYLAPVMHGLSSPSAPLLAWHLHAQRDGATESDEALSLPPTLLLGPWPRVVGTVNIDANSVSPARKVTARAAVLLLEPDVVLDVDAEVDRVRGRGAADPRPAGLGLGYLGDPRTALLAIERDVALDALQRFSDLMESVSGDVRLVPSRRDIDRSLQYMAYFVMLAQDWSSDVDVVGLAAENALLHFVLPQLPDHQFSEVLRALRNASLQGASEEPVVLGGLLQSRVQRLLQAMESGLFSDSLDFWAALS